MPRGGSRQKRRDITPYKPSKHGLWMLEDFKRFCKETRLIFPYYEQPIDEMCEAMGFTEYDQTKRTQQKKLYLAPRGSFKTSLVVSRIIFLLLKYPQIRLLLYRATRETAHQMLREVKAQLMYNEVILEHFGNLWEGSPKWDEDAIIITSRTIEPGDRDPSVMTIGVDGQTAGFHPDGVFMDDVVTEQNCDSPHLMDKAWRMMQSVYGLLQPWGWSLVTGTRWSSIDCYQRIIDINQVIREANSGKPEEDKIPLAYEEYIRTVYITNPETGAQELFFPGRLSQEFIDSQRNNPALEARYFESWYFNRMVDPRSKPFKMSDVRFFDCEYGAFPYKYVKMTGDDFAGEEVNVYVVMVVDPAMTANPSSCAYGLSVCGFDANRNFMMLDSRELIDVPSKADTVIFDMLQTYHPDLMIIESAGGDAALMTRIGGYLERQQLRTKVVGYSALQNEDRGRRSKEQRINAMEPYVTQGFMWIRRGFCNELVRQMDLYPSLIRNDVIDSWAILRYAQKFIPDARTFTTRKNEDSTEPDAYAITYFDKVAQREVTVGWDEYRSNPLADRVAPTKVSKGSWAGRYTR